MEPAIVFNPGTYYVGDPGFVLPNDDLRMLFSQAMHGNLTSGLKELVVSRKFENGKFFSDYYWIATTPNKQGTLYDQDGTGWGFDWGCFGVVPWKWIDVQSSYESNKIEFIEAFECFSNDEQITVGHLQFTFNPK